MEKKFYDELETRAPAQREAELAAALPGQIKHAQRGTKAFAAILAGIDPGPVNSRAALAKASWMASGESCGMSG